MDDIAVVTSVPWGTSLPLASVRAALFTLMHEWQSRSHCHSPSSVPGPWSRTATRLRAYRPGTFTTEWQCGLHCHSAPSVPRPPPCTATRLRAYRPGTFTPEWQCGLHCHSRPGAPRTRPRTATRPRACPDPSLHCQMVPCNAVSEERLAGRKDYEYALAFFFQPVHLPQSPTMYFCV